MEKLSDTPHPSRAGGATLRHFVSEVGHICWYCFRVEMLNEKMAFHSAKSGHKLDSILQDNKASFCVIDKEEIVLAEYTSYFRSVIVFGTVLIIESEQEQRAAIEKLALKYAPEDTAEHCRVSIERDWAPLCMLEVTVDHMSGKEAIELVKAKRISKV